MLLCCPHPAFHLLLLLRSARLLAILATVGAASTVAGVPTSPIAEATDLLAPDLITVASKTPSLVTIGKALGSAIGGRIHAANCVRISAIQLPIALNSSSEVIATNLVQHNLSSTGFVDWFPDTGANQHITPDLATLTASEPYLGNDNLHVGDGKGLPISHLGHTKIYTPHHSFTLSNVLHVPAITKPLLSVQKFYLYNNVYFEFHPRVFYVKDFNTHEVLLSGQSKDGLYALTKSSVTSVPQAYWSPCTSGSTDLWHRRLGHPTSRIFQLLISKNKIICNNKRLNFQCQSCSLGKSSCLSLGPTGHKTSAPLELIFSDVWGPAPLFSSDGYRYFVIFVDAYTKYVWYYPHVAKSDVYSVFHQFQTLVESQFSLKIKFVQTDWGGEYQKLSIFFQTIGIHHRLICPHTHEQNGTVERRHRHIVEIGLTLLGQCKAPFQFWNYAFETSVYLINRIPTPILANRSPFDCLFQRSLDYYFFRTFECLFFSFLRPYNNHKLDFRSSPCVFFGYSSSHLGYRCLDIASHRIYISRHVRFHEHVFPFDNFEQIAKVSTTTPTPPATVTLPNLLNHPPPPTFISHPNSPQYSVLPLQAATRPQPPPIPWPLSHACLSNPYDAGSDHQLVSSPHGLGALSSPSSASPSLASTPAALVSTSSPSFADSPVVELPQVSSLQPSSPASPPAHSRHPMNLRPRQPKTANLVASAVATSTSTRYYILPLLSLLHSLMLTGMQFGIMLCVMRSPLYVKIALGLWFHSNF